MQTVVPAALSTGLTSEEANFVYNLEVLDMPLKLAAMQAGCSVGKALAPHIIQARENMKRALRDTHQITKDDIINGFKEAIYDAKLIVDPMAQIRGWSAMAELLGLNQPTKVDINVNATIEVVKKQVREISDDELIARLGAESIIDADFYPVAK